MTSMVRLAVLSAVLSIGVGACERRGSATSRTPDPAPVASSTSLPSPVPLIVSPQPGVEVQWPDCRAVWVAGERLPSGYFGCALSEEFRSYDEDEPHFTDLTLDPPSGHDCGSGRWLVIAPFVDGHVQTPTGSTVLPDAATYYGFADGIIQRTETADRNADKRYQAAVAACLSKR